MRHFLVVDDNRAFAENLAEILRDGGAEATISGNGTDALKMVKAQKFDALVTDMRMPVMTGAALIHEVRRVDPGLPAIVVSAYTGESDLADARNEGVLAVLPKPVPIEQLQGLAQAARRNGLVVLVEDDETLADNLTEVLRANGFTALTARTLLEAKRFAEVEPMAALVDVRLPGSAPGEALHALKARYPRLPLIVISGYPHEAPSDVPLHATFCKPFDTAQVLQALQALYTTAEQRVQT